MELHNFRPSDADVDKKVAETGMGRVQAYRHLQQKMYLMSRPRTAYPLGKTAHCE